MSLKLVRTEILRFLVDTEPEVLCIKGKWGVGKTFAWKRYLSEAQEDKKLGLQQSSYVTLFGLNSLEELRFAIVEARTMDESEDQSATSGGFERLCESLARHSKIRPLVSAGSAVFRGKELSELFFKMAFTAVKNQVVCFDDLERAGEGLKVRDVLGLASFLKEERGCKVVLLLNDQQLLENEPGEFQRYLEKVCDVTLAFDLSAEEALEVALSGNQRVDKLLRSRVVELGISNIRVIKKIERLASKLADVLQDRDERVVEHAINTVVLAGWSVQEPDLAPPPEFIRNYNDYLVSRQLEDSEPEGAAAKWEKLLEEYPYQSTGKLEEIILDGAVSGYFREAELIAEATAVEKQIQHASRPNSFTEAWSALYHGSLATDDDEFLDALYKGATENLDRVSLLNLNSAIRMLREFDRKEQADEVVRLFIDARRQEPMKFFNLDEHDLSPHDPLDETLKDAFDRVRSEYIDPRDPLEVLRAMGEKRGWGAADIALMQKQSADDFERMFEALRGKEVRSSIETLLSLGRSNYPESDAILAAASAALRRIAGKSPMRASKVKRFGITLDSEGK